MNGKRRRSTIPAFDALDDRVVPSAIGARMHMAEGAHLRLAHRDRLGFLSAHAGAHFMAAALHARSGAVGRAAAHADPHIVAPIKVVGPTGIPQPSATSEPSLPSNASASLNTIYQQYEAAAGTGASASFQPSVSPAVATGGTTVGINAHTNGKGSFASYVIALKQLGMQVTGAVARTGTVAGFLPISALYQAADLPQTLGLSAMFRTGRG